MKEARNNFLHSQEYRAIMTLPEKSQANLYKRSIIKI